MSNPSFSNAHMAMWTSALVVIAIITGVQFLVIRRKPKKTTILGQQLATARANEAARLAAGNPGPSPLPKGAYDEENGDYNFATVLEQPLDVELRRVVHAFKISTSQAREETRQRISMDELYTLINFAKRSSVLALQERSSMCCEEALTALAMIDETRVDPRDVAWAVALVAHAIDAVGADLERLKSQAVALATPGMRRILARISEGSRLAQWGYTQIQSQSGTVGLVRSGRGHYQPTVDMYGLAQRLAATLQQGRYIAEPELAADLPVGWFEKKYRSRVEQLLKKSRAGICIHGRLRKASTPNPWTQQFTQWVIEIPSPDDASALRGCVEANAPRNARHTIGVVSGPLFSLLVAGSNTVGIEPFESPESLKPIVEQTQRILDEIFQKD